MLMGHSRPLVKFKWEMKWIVCYYLDFFVSNISKWCFISIKVDHCNRLCYFSQCKLVNILTIIFTSYIMVFVQKDWRPILQKRDRQRRYFWKYEAGARAPLHIKGPPLSIVNILWADLPLCTVTELLWQLTIMKTRSINRKVIKIYMLMWRRIT